MTEQLGKVVVFWSADGSPGRTALAAAFACEIAKTGKRVLVIDADTYAPSLIQHFGFDQNYSGLSAAVRAADQERLDDATFERLLLTFEIQKHSVQLLAGLTMVNRWPEIGFEKIRLLAEFARARFDFVIIDIASNIETGVVDANLLSERNSAAIGALSIADQVVAVAAADLVSLNRFIWAWQSIRELKLTAQIKVLVNRLNQGALGKKASAEIATSIRTLAEVQVDGFIDDDPALFARALAEGHPVALVGRNSQAKQAIASYAQTWLLEMPSKPNRRLAKLG